MRKRKIRRPVPRWIPLVEARAFRFTETNVRRLRAGPLTDTLVAVRFLGWKLEDLYDDEPEEAAHWMWDYGNQDVEHFRPSLEMVSAMQVYDKYRDIGYRIDLTDARGEKHTPGFWYEVCGMFPCTDKNAGDLYGRPVSHHCYKMDHGAPTVEMCICKAALMSLTQRDKPISREQAAGRL